MAVIREHEPIWLVICNVPDEDDKASFIARVLVEERLAACVNLFPAVQSVYRWQGTAECAVEIPLFIKTTAANWPELSQRLQQLHPYDTPEMIAIPLVAGLPSYLTWVASECVSSVQKDLTK